MDNIELINNITSSNDLFESLRKSAENNIGNATKTSIDLTDVNCIVPLILVISLLICMVIIAIARLKYLSNGVQHRR